ncbi:hypothetical protein ALPS_40 [Bacillus phage ALPS]|nr:hypothetical protein ALPS_40 [Bacillus phage ALPS]
MEFLEIDLFNRYWVFHTVEYYPRGDFNDIVFTSEHWTDVERLLKEPDMETLQDFNLFLKDYNIMVFDSETKETWTPNGGWTEHRPRTIEKVDC